MEGGDEEEEEEEEDEDGVDEEEENQRRYDFRQRKTVVRYQVPQDGNLYQGFSCFVLFFCVLQI